MLLRRGVGLGLDLGNQARDSGQDGILLTGHLFTVIALLTTILSSVFFSYGCMEGKSW